MGNEPSSSRIFFPCLLLSLLSCPCSPFCFLSLFPFTPFLLSPLFSLPPFSFFFSAFSSTHAFLSFSFPLPPSFSLFLALFSPCLPFSIPLPLFFLLPPPFFFLSTPPFPCPLPEARVRLIPGVYIHSIREIYREDRSSICRHASLTN